MKQHIWTFDVVVKPCVSYFDKEIRYHKIKSIIIQDGHLILDTNIFKPNEWSSYEVS